MKDSGIIRFLVGFLLTIVVVVYPIASSITEPAKVNSALTGMGFDKTFVDIFKEVAINEISRNTGRSSEVIRNEIGNDLISVDSFKKEREKAVVNLYADLDRNEIPVLEISLIDSLTNATSSFAEKLKTVASQVNDVKFCPTGDVSFLCTTFGDIFGGDIATSSSSTSTNSSLTIRTSFGVTKDSLPTVLNIYKALKYGPEIMIIVSAILLTLGYVLTFPSKKYAWKAIISMIKVDIFALLIWGVLPLLIRYISPVKVDGPVDLQSGINQVVNGALSETSRNAVIVPLAFTAATVFLFIIILLINRLISAQNGVKGYDRYDKSKKEIESDLEADSQVVTNKTEGANAQKVVSTNQVSVDSSNPVLAHPIISPKTPITTTMKPVSATKRVISPKK